MLTFKIAAEIWKTLGIMPEIHQSQDRFPLLPSPAGSDKNFPYDPLFLPITDYCWQFREIPILVWYLPIPDQTILGYQGDHWLSEHRGHDNHSAHKTRTRVPTAEFTAHAWLVHRQKICNQ